MEVLGGKELTFIRDLRDAGSIPDLGRSLGKGNGNLLQYSCLENPMHRGAWWAAVHRATKSLTRLKQYSTCAQRQINTFHKTEQRKILKLCPRVFLVGPMCFNTNHCNTVLIEAVLEGG